MAAVDLGQRAAQQAQQENKPQEIVEATTAFLVYVRKDDGRVVLTADLNAPITHDRAPTHDEILMQLHIVEKNITGIQFAELAAQRVLQQSMMLAQQAQAEQQLGQLGNLRT